jgi:Uncharacterised nucleotidyltransferase
MTTGAGASAARPNPIAPLMLALSRPQTTAEAVLSSRAALGADPQDEAWPTFLGMARKLKVAALLSWNAKRLAEELRSNPLPAAIVAELDLSRQQEAARNRMLPAEIDRVLGIAKAAGVHAVVRKGAHLARCVYPDVGLRPMGDVDLLAHPDQAEELAAALDANGYREGRPRGSVIAPLERSAKLFWRLYGSGPTQRHRLSGDPARPVVTIDISVSLFGAKPPFQIPTEQLLDRAVRYETNGIDLPVLSAEDTVLDLCANIYQNGTTLRAMNQGKHRRLINFVDIAEFVRLVGPGFTWSGFLQSVSRYRLQRPVLYALTQLHEVFPDVVPPATLAALRQCCPDWPTLLAEYGHSDLAEARRWPVDFRTRLFDDSFDRDIPRSSSPV